MIAFHKQSLTMTASQSGNNVVPLDSLPLGSRCRIVSVAEDSDSLIRLMEMGLIPGSVAVIERTAPLNSPFSVRLAGCTLAVRRDDACQVMVTPLPDTDA
jgi:ferrous iron transport protein A